MNKTMRHIFTGILAGLLIVSIFAGGFAAGYLVNDGIQDNFGMTESISAPVTAPTPMPETNVATPDELEATFAPFWEAWQIVHDDYVDQPVDDEAMMRGAIRGMLDSLGDQHTSYMDPVEYQQANSSIEGSYEGIGAWVDATGDYLAIVSPMPGSPAEAAGLEPGDLIVAIDGEDMTGIPGDLVIKKVLGPAGSTVELTVQRKGESEPLQFEVTRAKIVVPSIEGEMLDDQIGYIHIFTFGTTTAEELRDSIQELLDQDAQGLVIDFRNNGGGLLNTAIKIASEFLNEGDVVLYERYGDGTQDIHNAIPGGLATDIPIVVLINEGSASASEVVAGALQDHERGELVGATSFGKGSVQNWIPLNNNEGAVRVTIAKWLTPDERTIHEIGLTPDVVVEVTDEDIANEVDPQLDKAVEILLDQINGN